MKAVSVIGVVVVAVLIGLGIYLIDVDQTEEGSLPNVEMSVEEGSMPEFEAEVGDIETGSEDVTIEVPTIDLESPEEEAANGG